MDIARPDIAQRKKRRRLMLGAVAAIVVLAVSLGLSRLRPAAPSVDSTVWIDEVKRGPMLRQVRGLGTLVPEEIRWIAAATEGRVERLVVLPGTPVKADTVLLELKNPEVELAALDAVSQLRGAEASLAELRVRLESQRLNQEADLARVESEYRQAQLKADTDAVLAKQGLVADLNRQISALAAEEMGKREKVALPYAAPRCFRVSPKAKWYPSESARKAAWSTAVRRLGPARTSSCTQTRSASSAAMTAAMRATLRRRSIPRHLWML